MSDALILNIYQFLGWSFICVVCGSFFGAAVCAFAMHEFERLRDEKVDHEANQAKADELFAPISVRAGK